MANPALITVPRVIAREGNVIKLGFDRLKPNPPKPPYDDGAAMRVVA